MIACRTEATLQRAIVELLRKAAHGDVLWFHVPNGEHRNAVTGARLKSLGVRPGVADLAFVLPGGRAAFLELKRDNGRQSQSQRIFESDCERSGAYYEVARNIDEAIGILRAWRVINSNTTAAAGRGAEAGSVGNGVPRPQSTAEVPGVPV